MLASPIEVGAAASAASINPADVETIAAPAESAAQPRAERVRRSAMSALTRITGASTESLEEILEDLAGEDGDAQNSLIDEALLQLLG